MAVGAGLGQALKDTLHLLAGGAFTHHYHHGVTSLSKRGSLADSSAGDVFQRGDEEVVLFIRAHGHPHPTRAPDKIA